jgi:hypothetical protein
LTGHELPLTDAAPPQCHKKTIKQGRGDGADRGMSCLRPTPHHHHAPLPHQWRLHERPKEDLDGAARMSCTRRRRGAPKAPGDRTLGSRPVSCGGRASGSRAHRPAAPILSVRPSIRTPYTPIFSGEGKMWGEEAAGRSNPGGGSRGGPAQLAGRRNPLSHRPARGMVPPPWEASVRGRE